MNNVQKSLQDNLAEIKKTLPEEFWGGLEAEAAAAAPVPVLDEAAAKAAVVAEVKENPTIDDAAVMGEVEANLSIPAPLPAPSEAEQAAAEAEEAKIEKTAPPEGDPA